MSIRSDYETTVVKRITIVATSSRIIIFTIIIIIIVTRYNREVHGHKWGALVAGKAGQKFIATPALQPAATAEQYLIL